MTPQNMLELKTQLACAKRIYKLTAQAQRDADENRLQTVLDQYKAQKAYDQNPNSENREALEQANQAFKEADEKWVQADYAAYNANRDKTHLENLLAQTEKENQKWNTHTPRC